MSDRLNLDRRQLFAGGAIASLTMTQTAQARTTDVQSSRTPIDGLDVYYEVHGGPLTSGVEPFVLLHGGMLAIETAFGGRWLPALSALGRPVIGVEQQGHGHTGLRPGPFTVDRAVADAIGVLDHLGVSKAVFVGHSYGGMISLGTALAHPDRVAAVFPVSSGYRLDGMLPDIAAVQTNPDHPVPPEVAALFPTEEDFGQWVSHYNAVNPDPSTFMDVLARMNAMLGAWEGWSEDQLRALTVPTLLISGDNDFMRLDHMTAMHDLIPNAQLAILPGTTHMNILDRGDWIVPMIAARLQA
jgi:pimeloyl-ACP methyl ester carboxylesterase